MARVAGEDRLIGPKTSGRNEVDRGRLACLGMTVPLFWRWLTRPSLRFTHGDRRGNFVQWEPVVCVSGRPAAGLWTMLDLCLVQQCNVFFPFVCLPKVRPGLGHYARVKKKGVRSKTGASVPSFHLIHPRSPQYRTRGKAPGLSLVGSTSLFCDLVLIAIRESLRITPYRPADLP